MRKFLGLVLFCMMMLNIFVGDYHVHAAENTQNRLRVVSVIASGDDGNIPENTIDNIDSTRWSAKDVNDAGQWIIYDLGEEKTIDYLGIAFYKGNIRYTILDISVSSDATNWSRVYEKGHTDEASLDMIKFDIDTTTARYVKVTGYGYEYFEKDSSGASVKTGDWVSIIETHLYSSDNVEMDPMMTIEDEAPDKTITYTEPGLINPDGTKHSIHKRNEVTGKKINVADSGIKDSGEDASDVIQGIIDSAEAGDEIYFPDGQYNFKSAIKLKSGVNLKGESQDGTIFMAAAGDNGYADSIIVMNGINNVVISNLTITSEFDGNYSTDHKINNPEADGPRYPIAIRDNLVIEDAVKLYKPSYNITVNNVLIEKYQTMGIRVENSHDIVISNSTFQNATDVGGGGAGYGVSIQGDGNNINRLGYANDSRFNVIKNCTFKGPYLRHGVILQYYTHNNEVYDNTLIQTKLDAIDLHGEDEYLNEIYDNTIKDIETGAGIAAGNTGASHDKSGTGNYIHDNDISNCREGIKIHLGTEDTRIENNKITGSTVDNAKGIYLQNAPGTIVKDNKIIDNTSNNFWAVYIERDPGTKNRGFGSPKNIKVEENVFKNCSNGVYISDGKEIAINGNKYKNIENSKVTDIRTYKYTGSLIPSDVLDLTNWKLTLPISKEVGTGAKEIKQPDLNGYVSEYFYVNDETGAVVFNAPCDADGTGATTTNSSYPRSELREMTKDGTQRASWSTGSGTHTMIIDEMITNTPVAKPHVVVGQIHDADDDVIMIRLENQRLFVQAESEDLGTLDSDYQLGTRFQVKVHVEDNKIYIYYNDTLKVTYPVVKTGCYFKAGMYTQSNTSKGDAADAYGEVEIFNVTVEHTEGSENPTDKDEKIIEIPNSDATKILTPSMDTYIELSKVDGNVVGNIEAKNDSTTLAVKTSGGQTTIRLAFVEFDLSSYNDNFYTGQLKLNKKSCNGNTTVSVYATTETFDDDIVWTDVLDNADRISKGNTGVIDWLKNDINATKIGEIDFYEDTAPDSGNKDVTDYYINTSNYLNSDFTGDAVTFILIEENGDNVYLKLDTAEGEKPVELQLWSSSFANDFKPKVIQTSMGKYLSATSTSLESESISPNSDVEDINTALGLLTYDILTVTKKKIILPSSIGEDVIVNWSSGNSDILDGKGNIRKLLYNTDVTLTATLTKNNEVMTKEFVFVINGRKDN